MPQELETIMKKLEEINNNVNLQTIQE